MGSVNVNPPRGVCPRQTNSDRLCFLQGRAHAVVPPRSPVPSVPAEEPLSSEPSSRLPPVQVHVKLPPVHDFVSRLPLQVIVNDPASQEQVKFPRV